MCSLRLSRAASTLPRKGMAVVGVGGRWRGFARQCLGMGDECGCLRVSAVTCNMGGSRTSKAGPCMVTMQVIRQRKTARDTGAVIDPRGECVVFLLSTAPPLLSGGSRTGYFSGDCFASGVLGADPGGYCGRPLVVPPHPGGDRRDQCVVEHFFCLATVNVVYC